MCCSGIVGAVGVVVAVVVSWCGGGEGEVFFLPDPCFFSMFSGAFVVAAAAVTSFFSFLLLLCEGGKVLSSLLLCTGGVRFSVAPHIFFVLHWSVDGIFLFYVLVRFKVTKARGQTSKGWLRQPIQPPPMKGPLRSVL